MHTPYNSVSSQGTSSAFSVSHVLLVMSNQRESYDRCDCAIRTAPFASGCDAAART